MYDRVHTEADAIQVLMFIERPGNYMRIVGTGESRMTSCVSCQPSTLYLTLLELLLLLIYYLYGLVAEDMKMMFDALFV